MKRRELVLALLAAGSGVGAKTALPAEVSKNLPGARLIGSGRLTYFGLNVYDARLWASGEFKATDYAAAPLALELEYARALDGEKIAERSLEEMKRSGPLTDDQAQRWLATMKRTFPDVAEGDRITGVQLAGGVTRFFVNGKPSGELRDAEFTRRFFGIWLSPKTSEPKLRLALLGPQAGASRSPP